MDKLSTIQKREKLNDIYSVDDEGPGGAHHKYIIAKVGTEMDPISKDVEENIVGVINFQCGARKEEDAVSGVIDSDLLEIVRDRLKSFQEGTFASDYNANALKYVELALMYLNMRVEDRIERGVLGTNIK